MHRGPPPASDPESAPSKGQRPTHQPWVSGAALSRLRLRAAPRCRSQNPWKRPAGSSRTRQGPALNLRWGPDYQGTGAEPGRAVQPEGCGLVLRSRGRGGRGAGAGGGTPSGMSPCCSGTGAGGRGAGGVTGLSHTASAPAPSRASQPAPCPSRVLRGQLSPLGMHRVPDVVSAAPEPTSSAWV